MGMLVKFGGKMSGIQVVSSGIYWNISSNTSCIPVEISDKIWSYYQWYTGIPVVSTPQISCYSIKYGMALSEYSLVIYSKVCHRDSTPLQYSTPRLHSVKYTVPRH